VKNRGLVYLKAFLSPSLVFACIVKDKMYKKNGARGKFNAIFCLNRSWLFISISIFTLLGFFDVDKYLSSSWQFFVAYLFLFSRVNEIFFAFIGDAFDKLSHTKNYCYFKLRLNLAFASYLEIIVSFASMYFLLSSNDIHSIAISGIKDAIDALYYSGVTVTTLGYGDFSPTQWYTRLLSIYQVLCGFSLLLVSFTIYTNRAIK
jgi:voltage-gated potassium channel